MKKILLALTALFLLCGCEKDDPIITDWSPVVFNIAVKDAAGNDLLDPRNGNSWLEGTTFEFMWAKDTIDRACLDNVQTKYYLPGYTGITLNDNGFSGIYCLSFGEFEGHANYNDEKLTIRWPDGRTNVITYNRSLNKSMTKLKRTSVLLDGKECTGMIVIVR